MLLGDSNFPSINWLLLTAKCDINSALSNNFIDFCASYNLHQIVPEPTKNGHYLDLILTSMLDRFYNVQLVPPIRDSDHNAINYKFVTAVSNSESSQQLVYNFAKPPANY